MSSNRRRLAAQRRSQSSGSPIEDEPEFVVVAKLRRPHALKGEALVSVLSEFPERIVPGAELYLGKDRLPITVRSRREHNDGLLLAFKEYPTREDLEGFQNQLIYVKAADVPDLAEGEYYHHELIGLGVYDEAGKPLGTLSQILVTGANDVYVVRREHEKEILLPATSEVIREIDLEQKRLIVQLLPGLLDE